MARCSQWLSEGPRGEVRGPSPASPVSSLSHGLQSQLNAMSRTDSRQLLRRILRPHPGSVGKNVMIDEQSLLWAREGGMTDVCHKSAVFQNTGSSIRAQEKSGQPEGSGHDLKAGQTQRHLSAKGANRRTANRCHRDRDLWSKQCGRLSMKLFVPMERTVVESPLPRACIAGVVA